MTRILACLAASCAALSFHLAGSAQTPAPTPRAYLSAAVDTAHGDREVILLWPNGAPGAVGSETQDRPKLTVYRARTGLANGTAAIVCPGGSYARLASDHEGKQVAEWLNALGVSAFVLQYRVGPRYRHPAPLQDAQRALRLVRTRAGEFGIDVARVGIVGFSAGGHLASTTGTHFDEGKPESADPMERAASRPDFMVLAYPVISFSGAFAHKGSVENLLGERPDPKLLAELSSELRTTSRTPPTFLFHTAEDATVPVENSLAFYDALRARHVPAELHVFPNGPHGMGLAPGDAVLSQWPMLCAAWLRAMGFLGPPARLALVAGEGLKEPFGVAFDTAGNAYVVEMAGNRVSMLSRDGKLSVLAGAGEKGLAGDGGPAAAARFNGPHHLLMGPDGALYVADTGNNCIRRIDLGTRVVTRVAGTGERGFSGDGGPAVEARFGGIYAIAFRGSVLYAADLDNRRIRAIDLATGVVTTAAGNGEKGVPRDGEDARSQPLVDPRAVAVDSSGNLYICERNGHALRVVDAAGKIRTVAGTGEEGFSGDGGAARQARLRGPKHISIDANDDVLVTDTENHAIRLYSHRDGTIRRVAGSGEKGAAGIGGPALESQLDRPHGAVVQLETGAVYIADSGNHRVVRIEK